MQRQSKRPTEEDIRTAVDRYSDMLFRLCAAMLGNRADAEDALSETMLRYMTKGQRFESEEHRKAWLLRVASNICKDMCRFRKRNAYVNLDDITHIDILQKHGGVPECVCCRYNPGGDFKISGTIMGNPGEAKYGFTYAQLEEGLAQLKALGAKRFGLHAFLSSNTIDNAYYPALAKILFTCGRNLAEKTGLAFAFANLSGGVGIPYRPEQKKTDIAAVGEGVRKAYEEVFPNGGVAIKTELGRWMTGPNGWLVSHATHHKDTYKHYVGLDACAANLMRPAMYGAYHHITVCGKRNAPCDHVYDVTGSLCENNDKFAINRALPEIKDGDLVVIHDTGAHGFSMGYNYNGRLRSAEILYTTDGSYRMIRRAETPQDYFATLDIDPAAEALGVKRK